jgi:hypothetical protein
MDSFIEKLGILILGMLISNFIPLGTVATFAFFLGVVLGIIIEVLILYMYIITKSKPIQIIRQKTSLSSLEENTNKAAQSFIRNPKRNIPEPNYEKRLDIVECICSEESFEIIITGNEKYFLELLDYMKEFISNQKKYGNGLIKLGEIGLIEQLNSKKSMKNLKNFRNLLFEIGQKYLKESENLYDSIIPKISSFEKESKIKYKELAMQLTNAGVNFYNLTNDIKKQLNKLPDLQSVQKKASKEFKIAKKDLAQFETLVKKEMKLKKVTNDISVIKNQIHNLSSSMQKESAIYLPKATKIMKELSEFDKIKISKYKSILKLWLSCLLQVLNFSYDSIEAFELKNNEEETLEIKGANGIKLTLDRLKSAVTSNKISEKLKLKKMFSNLASSFHSKSKELEKKLEKLEGHGNDLYQFFNLMINTEEEFLKEYIRVISNWHELKNPELKSKILEFKTRFLKFFKEDYEYKSQMYVSVNKSKSFIEEVHTLHKDSLRNFTPDELNFLEHRVKELSETYLSIIVDSKENLLKCLKQRTQNFIAEINISINNLSQPESLQEDVMFNRIAKNHRVECPHYMHDPINYQEENFHIEEPVKVGSPESGIWLNDLLSAYISEWRNSPKFKSYLCARLKKIFNKDNPDYIGEIEVKDVEIGDQAPELKDLIRLKTENVRDFFYEFDLWFRGDIKIHLEFELKWSVAAFLVNIKVVLRSFYSKLRIFYTPSNIGTSWYSFISEPVHQIVLEPVLGKMNKIALSKFPQINSLLVSTLSKKIRKYVWPNKSAIKIYKGNKSTFTLD